MSVATVRAAVKSWLAGTTGLANVYLDQPTVIENSAFEGASGFGPVAFVHIEHFSETRIGLPAGAGLKEVTYDVGVVLIVRHIIQPDETGHDEWVADSDAAIDHLRDRIRADFTFGTAGAVVWQAGEDMNDIQVTLDLPKFEGSIVEHWVLVQFKVQEIVQPV